MKKFLTIILTVVLMITLLSGQKTVAMADDFEGVLTIVVEHTKACGYDNEKSCELYKGESHTFVAKIYETESGKDVTDEYTVEWEADYFHGEVADVCSIAPDGNNCVVNCIDLTEGNGNVILFARIMGEGEFLGIGTEQFKIKDAADKDEAITEEDAEILEESAEEQDDTAETEAVSAESAETIAADNVKADESESEAENGSSGSNRNNTALFAGFAAVATCCFAAAAARKKKGGKSNKE